MNLLGGPTETETAGRGLSTLWFNETLRCFWFILKCTTCCLSPASSPLESPKPSLWQLNHNHFLSTYWSQKKREKLLAIIANALKHLEMQKKKKKTINKLKKKKMEEKKIVFLFSPGIFFLPENQLLLTANHKSVFAVWLLRMTTLCEDSNIHLLTFFICFQFSAEIYLKYVLAIYTRKWIVTILKPQY